MIRQRYAVVSIAARGASRWDEALRHEVLRDRVSAGERNRPHIVRPMVVSLGLFCSCAGPLPQVGQQAASVDAYDNARCTGYGLKPLDPEYAQCRHALAQMRYPGDPQAALAALTIDNLARRSAGPRAPEP